ncbi:FAD-dependent oxidoreductase [Streptomyces sp. NPDC098781]|uniref:FAD-dependent oxidoreductase n=1 Tax=Streptomyces sp. NPDC098781 TaxID=3366097 RepID=UPI0037F93F8E
MTGAINRRRAAPRYRCLRRYGRPGSPRDESLFTPSRKLNSNPVWELNRSGCEGDHQAADQELMMTHALVVGAGPTGLVTAMLLAAEGWRVTVVDRDPAHPSGDATDVWTHWKRPGVNQFALTHCLMPGGLRVLANELPDTVTRLRELGARDHNMIGGAWGYGNTGAEEPTDTRFKTLATRRPVLEAALLATARETPGITIRRGLEVTGLLTGDAHTSGRPHITGITTSTGESFQGNLVIDAGGRNSRVAELLADVGATAHTERAETGFRYYSRHFRSTDGTLPRQAPWPLYHHDSVSLITAPGDNDTWSVTLVTSGRDQELRALSNSDVWQRTVALYPDVAHWATHGEPITGVLAMAGTESKYRRFIDGELPVATGIFAVGDAWATTNPQFGLGMALGFTHATMLRDLVRMVGTDDPVELALRFDSATEQHLTPGWHSLAAWDRHRLAEVDADIRGVTYKTDDFDWNLNVALESARWKDPAILRGMAEVACALATAEDALVKKGLVEKTVTLGADGPRHSDEGPSRRELLAIAGADA